jgi:1,4-dihydroxy-2-naphthoyl-CoA hydrolase
MAIWFNETDIEKLNTLSRDTMVEHLDITFDEIGDDYLKASMPVDHRTIQPAGLLHGGASVSLAETLGSVASVLVVDPEINSGAVGIEINANHLKAAFSGDRVIGIVKPISIGKSIHVWDIKIYNSKEDLCCVSRLTTKVLKKR